jgi:broad specificity phosphatase PhoE
MEEAGVELWLVRHGETEWSRTGRHTGRQDVPLTEEGEAQARRVGALLAGRSFELVLTSPLRRARATCDLAGYGAAAREEPDLMEWDYGAAEGRTYAEVQRDLPGWNLWRDGPPAGEPLAAIGARADRVIARAVAAGDGAVALFAHGHVLRVLAARWLGLAPDGARLLGLDPATVSVLGHERATRVLRRWNVPPRPL